MFCRSLGLLLVLVAAVCSVPVNAWTQDQDVADFEQELKARLESHRYLKRSQFEWVRDHEPYLFVVQLPAGRDAAWATDVASRRGAWLSALHDKFAKDCATPMGLRLQSARPRLAVVVLANEEEFGYYLSVERLRQEAERTARYDPKTGLLVLHEDPFHQPTDADLPRSHLELREAAYQLVHGYSARVTELDPLWLREGLADDLAAHRQLEPASLDERQVSDFALRTLVGAMKDRTARAVYLLPIYQFLRQESYAALHKVCATRRSGAAAFAYDEEISADVYRATAGALYHYFGHAAPSKTQRQLKAFVEEAMKGSWNASSFARNFPGVSLAKVERDLWQYVWNEHRRRWPGERLDPTKLSAFLAERGAPGLEPEDIVVDIAPTALLEALTDPEAHVAMAIARTRAGDPEGGVKLLDDCLAKGVPEVAARRVLLEKERIEAWTKARDAFLNHLVALDRKFSFTPDQKRLLATVEAYSDGVLRFGDNKLGVTTIAVADIDPLELARCMGEKKWGFEAGWALAYPYVISYDKKVKRFLRGDAPELERLTEDFEKDYPARQDLIEVAAGLLALVDLGQPKSAEEAVSGLILIDQVWKARQKAPFVTDLQGTLRELAAQALEKRLDEEGPGIALHGKAKMLEGGRIRLAYDFEKPEQLDDWLSTDDRARPRGTFGELESDEERIEVHGGVLSLSGPVARRHVLEFEGAQSFQWKNKMLAGEGVSEDRQLVFHVSFCLSNKTGNITVVNSIALEVADFKARDNRRQDPPQVDVRYDNQYLCMLEHDGKSRIRFLRDGNEIFADDQCEALKSGAVQLWVHSDYVVEFDDVEISGKVTEKSLEELKERWIEAEVEGMGLAKM